MNGLWQRASFCCSGMCVEVQITPTFVFVRNSEGGPVATFDHREWRAFVAAAAAGEFNIKETS